MNIRNVNESDIDNGLLEIFVEGYRFHQLGRPDIFLNRTEDIFKEILNELLDRDNFIILEENKKIIGYASYQFKEKNKRKTLWLDELIITENYRGKGYGKKLVQELENIAKLNECIAMEFTCWNFNKNAQGMYEHLGYTVQKKTYEKEI